jgi:hypothetical protein
VPGYPLKFFTFHITVIDPFAGMQLPVKELEKTYGKEKYDHCNYLGDIPAEKFQLLFPCPVAFGQPEKGDKNHYDRGGPGQRAEPEQQTQGYGVFPGRLVVP